MSYGSEHSGKAEFRYPLLIASQEPLPRSLVVLERNLCFCMGRPASLHAEDYHVEPPLEVDDEYWDRGFIQPLGKPSQVSYFVFYLRLFEILGDVMRRLYGSKNRRY